MTPSDNERIAALAEALARVEARLARLEAAAGLNGPREEAAAPPPAPEPPPPPPPPPRPAPPRPRLETRVGLTWVNRVAVVTLVLGVAFFFKFAVDAGWIGEWTRVLLGAMAGVAAIAMGERTWRGGQQVWAQGVSAAGIGILYVSFYAAYGLYRLLPQAAAFALLAATTAAAVALALRYAAPALAALGLAGGFLTPVAAGAADGQPWFVMGYVLLLDGGALYVARARRWRGLEALALIGTVWLYGASSAGRAARRAGDTLFLLSYYGLFAAGPLRWIFVPAQLFAALGLAELWPAAPAAYFALAAGVAAAGLVTADRLGWALAPAMGYWLGYVIWRGQQRTAPGMEVFWLVTIGFAVLFVWAPWRAWKRGRRARLQDLLLMVFNAGFYFAVGYTLLPEGYAGAFAALLAALHTAFAWRVWSADSRLAALSAGVAWALLLLAAPAQFSGYRVTMIWALEGAALAWIGGRLRDGRAVWGALAVFYLVLIRLGFVDAGLAVSTTFANARFLSFAFAAACFWAGAWWMPRRIEALVAYVAGQVAAVWGLSLEALGWAARSAAPADLRSAESTALSMAWAGWAVLLVSAGVAARSAINRVLGLGLIAVVVVKLYLYDVWFLGLFYRMVAFAVLGALLLLMSYLYSRFRGAIENWWREPTERRR